LQHNAHVRDLEVGVEQVYDDEDDDAPILPSDPASALRCLRISVDQLTGEGRLTLVRQLRTNTALEELHVLYRASSSASPRTDLPLIDLLEAYNFTLVRLTEQYGEGSVTLPGTSSRPVGGAVPYLRRNQQIRRALQQLPHYRVTPPALLPAVLEVVSRLPTLLYRFLRRGNVNAVVEHLAQKQHKPPPRHPPGDSRITKKRRGPPHGGPSRQRGGVGASRRT
jgi:hypothetical protein